MLTTQWLAEDGHWFILNRRNLSTLWGSYRPILLKKSIFTDMGCQQVEKRSIFALLCKI
ncbi:hypothetical protein L483_14830 [Pseudomonas putida H8234]|jgi:hypothetical protein|nr:hypothetical protein L483_14830 [Pseudomonas putida H8234]